MHDRRPANKRTICEGNGPTKVLLSIESRSLRGLFGRQHQGLTAFDHVPWPAHRGRRVHVQDAIVRSSNNWRMAAKYCLTVDLLALLPSCSM
jgi:hypothetical protein